ncbi:hypothetical protein [Spirillospora sp. NPDC029432]|uniref:hypothetical protein n=1 Tax=Spirillospora sp. NPDC029432 TaxID=3154599 RepID=UPI003451A17E
MRRLLNCVPGVLLIGLSVFMFAPRALDADSSAVPAALGVLILLAGITLAVRAYRLGVEIRDGEVVLRGVLRTTRIPQATVTHVDVREATLVWRRPDGAVRRTKVAAFTARESAPSDVREYNQRRMTEIRKAIKGR